LNRAISQLSAISNRPMPPRSHSHNYQQAPGNHNQGSRSGNSESLYCAEQDLSLEQDICFGRGQRVQRRKANVAFRKIVATYQETYDQAESREDKKAVVKRVARIFSRTGYRFFKESEDAALYGNGSRMWIAVSDHHVEYKIGHSFRSGRKQLKQQKNQRKEKESSAVAIIISSGDAQTDNSRPRLIVAKEPSNHSVFKEDELSNNCICIGDNRTKYTGMEAYQYFREFILTFKSIFGSSDSIVDKKKVVTSLIEQMQSRKGYQFLKLVGLFWVQASTDEISCEVFSILDDSQEPNEKKSICATESALTNDNNGVSSALGRNNQKRSHDSIDGSDDVAPKKRQCLMAENAWTRIDRNIEPKTNDDKARQPAAASSIAEETVVGNAKEHLGSSASGSTTTKEDEKRSSKLKWKKGRKRSLPGASKIHALVPSKIIRGLPVANDKLKNKKDPVSKAGKEIMSAISNQGIRVPQSLSLPSVFFGKISLGNRSSATLDASRRNHSLSDITSREKILQGKGRLPGFGPSSTGFTGQATLAKALLAMRSPALRRGERAMSESVGRLEAAKEIEMKANLLQHLQQQELLYMEKKHKLDMLDLQMRAPNSGI